MTTKEVTVKSQIGLHARPAAELVNIVKNYKSTVHIENGDKKANAGSIINLLTLGAKEGVVLTVMAEGEDEAAAVDEVVKFLDEMRD